MGYPMTWARLCNRNVLCGNYTNVRGFDGYLWPTTSENLRLLMIAGDLRRLEQDSVDGQYATKCIAERAGVGIEDTIRVLRAFFDGAPALPPHDDLSPSASGDGNG